MSLAEQFAEKYDCVVICGNFRFGSTALSVKLSSWLTHLKCDVLWLNEFFTAHHFVDFDEQGKFSFNSIRDDFIPFDGDSHAIELALHRPIPDSLVRFKIGWLKDKMRTHKIVLKTDPVDWTGASGKILEDFIFENPRIYKLGLNRRDIGNAMISYLIGIQCGYWNSGESEFKTEMSKSVNPVPAHLHRMQEFWNFTLTHNNWLWYMHRRIDHLVWYDQIENLQISEIGLISEPSKIWTYKNPIPHSDRLKKYFTNPDAVADVAKHVQDNMHELIDSVYRLYRNPRLA